MGERNGVGVVLYLNRFRRSCSAGAYLLVSGIRDSAVSVSYLCVNDSGYELEEVLRSPKTSSCEVDSLKFHIL